MIREFLYVLPVDILLPAAHDWQIENIQFIERGYGNIVNKLKSLGAQIKRVGLSDSMDFSKAL